MIKNKQSGLELILNKGFSLDNLIEREERGAMTEIERMKEYFIATRNNYSFMFLNFSSSVWRLSKNPQYLTNYSDKGVFSTTKDLKNIYSPEEIETFNKINETELLNSY